MGRSRACAQQRQPRRQRRLLLCELSAPQAALTAFGDVYIDNYAPRHSCWRATSRVVTGVALPYKAGQCLRGWTGARTPAEEIIDGVEESRRRPMGLGPQGTVGLRPAAGRTAP